VKIEQIFLEITLLPLLLLIISIMLLPLCVITYRRHIEATIPNYLIMSLLLAIVGTFSFATPLLFFTDNLREISPFYFFPLSVGIFFVALMDELPPPFRNRLYKKLQPVSNHSDEEFTFDNDEEYIFESEQKFSEIDEEKFPSFEELIA